MNDNQGPSHKKDKPNPVNTTTLAFLGDAFYELEVRRRLAEGGGSYAADKLHAAAVRYVNASSQAKALRGLMEHDALSEEELDIVRKARNRKPKSVPKHTDPVDYKYATAFEALLGWHYMEGRAGRAGELTELAILVIGGGVKL